jgi:hypothetical protein
MADATERFWRKTTAAIAAFRPLFSSRRAYRDCRQEFDNVSCDRKGDASGFWIRLDGGAGPFSHGIGRFQPPVRRIR